MRAWIACTALTATLCSTQVAGQSAPEGPELPPDLAKPAPIVEVPLPVEPPRVVEKPKPRPAPQVAPPKPPPLAIPKPAPPPVAPSPPPTVTVQKPAAAPAPAPADPKPQAECEIKPVMSDDDLRACGVRR